MPLPAIGGQDPIYWGVERNAEGKRLSVAWMAQADPPYRYGRAIRVRIGVKAYHLGVCKKSKRPFMRPLQSTHEEISKWVS